MKHLIALVMAALILAAGCTRRTPTPTQSVSPATQPPATATATPAQTPQQTATPPAQAQAPALPDKLTVQDGTPIIDVYVVEDKQIVPMGVEEYLYGVVAGEMKNDWPQEALRAQAILARSFLMYFLENKQSSLHSEKADISTDIQESQAYDASAINDAIKEAVDSTAGKVLIYDGAFIATWFHASSGGKTAMAKEALDYKDEEPPYIHSVESDESSAPEDVQSWTATFTKKQLLQGLEKAGMQLSDIKSFEIGEQGPSGRVVTFIVNDKPVNASTLRVHLGSTKFRSTLLSQADYADGKLTLQGKGYGHGVGLSQWGAYGMAKAGKTAQDILLHYYKDVELAQVYP